MHFALSINVEDRWKAFLHVSLLCLPWEVGVGSGRGAGLQGRIAYHAIHCLSLALDALQVVILAQPGPPDCRSFPFLQAVMHSSSSPLWHATASLGSAGAPAPALLRAWECVATCTASLDAMWVSIRPSGVEW